MRSAFGREPLASKAKTPISIAGIHRATLSTNQLMAKTRAWVGKWTTSFPNHGAARVPFETYKSFKLAPTNASLTSHHRAKKECLQDAAADRQICVADIAVERRQRGSLRHSQRTGFGRNGRELDFRCNCERFLARTRKRIFLQSRITQQLHR